MKTRQIQFLTLAVFTAFTASACGAKKITLAPEEGTGGKKGLLSIQINSVKDKKKKFDLETTFMNESTKPIIVFIADLQCSRGAMAGTIISKDFIFSMPAGQMRKTVLTCDYRQPAKGEMKLVVKKVYDNPTEDGTTEGKVIATDVEWKASDAK